MYNFNCYALKLMLNINYYIINWALFVICNCRENFEYAEAHCSGAGAETSKRVRWEKQLSADQAKKFTDNSFIDHDGWIAKLPSVS